MPFNWKLAFVLPNLPLNQAFEAEHMAIVPKADHRIKIILRRTPNIQYLLDQFSDQYMRPIQPCALLFRDDIPESALNIEAIVAFRNIFAISCIIKGWAWILQNEGQVIYPLYSDYFDFYPVVPHSNGQGYVRSSPASTGYDHPNQFQGQTSPQIGSAGITNAVPDDVIYSSLLRFWTRAYVLRRVCRREFTVLFRSLEMAYQASSIPFKNRSRIYDFGSNIALWVSAFEVLAHPDGGNANLSTVLDLLNQASWLNRRLGACKYKIKDSRIPDKRPLIQKLYKELYDARNDFLHGNPVVLSRLYPFLDKDKAPLTAYAPLIYRIALSCFLNDFRDKRRKMTLAQAAAIGFSQGEVEQALLTAV